MDRLCLRIISLRVSACVSVHGNLIIGMVLHLDFIQVTSEYQDHWVKVKVTQWKMLILLPGHHFNLPSVTCLSY